jgi:hypothetical protein
MNPFFTGEVEVRWLHDWAGKSDREMLLLSDFSFTDSTGYVWTAPAGTIVDGSSIPKCLWWLVGNPLIGDHRRASVVHDAACQKREKTSKAVAWMFYEAMRTDGFNWFWAKAYWLAVRYRGPQWS